MLLSIMGLFVIALLIVWAVVGAFAVQNQSTVHVSLLSYAWDVAEWIPAAIAAAAVSVLLVLHMLGAGIGYQRSLCGFRREVDMHRQAIAGLEEENARLRRNLTAAGGRATPAVA